MRLYLKEIVIYVKINKNLIFNVKYDIQYIFFIQIIVSFK
jgi:hypothetical protein